VADAAFRGCRYVVCRFAHSGFAGVAGGTGALYVGVVDFERCPCFAGGVASLTAIVCGNVAARFCFGRHAVVTRNAGSSTNFGVVKKRWGECGGGVARIALLRRADMGAGLAQCL